MKFFLAIFAALAVASAETVPGETKLTLSRPEGTRTFYVWEPKSYATATSVALVFYWHGYTNKCEDHESRTSYNVVADKNNFIAVSACGFGPTSAFNAGVCCGGASWDDVEFARLIIAKVRDQWPKVNASRVFSSGFSNGGMMSEQLACKSAHLFRAIASVAGVTVVNPGGLEGLSACDSAYANVTRKVGILHIHGNADPTVPWNGNTQYRFPAIPTDHKRWSQRNKCVGSPVQTFKQGIYSNEIYKDCNGGPVELLTVEGGAHAWPNHPDFSAAEYAWKFFSQF